MLEKPHDLHYWFYKELLERLHNLEVTTVSKEELTTILDETKQEVEAKLATKVNTSTFVAFRTEITNLANSKVSQQEFDATISEIEKELDKKLNKSEFESRISNYYTKEETNTKIEQIFWTKDVTQANNPIDDLNNFPLGFAFCSESGLKNAPTDKLSYYWVYTIGRINHIQQFAVSLVENKIYKRGYFSGWENWRQLPDLSSYYTKTEIDSLLTGIVSELEDTEHEVIAQLKQEGLWTED